MKSEEKPYIVGLWGSHPDENNDDCWMGFDFDTRFEAVRKYTELLSSTDDPYVSIDGPDINEVSRTKAPIRPVAVDDDEWNREILREEMMLHGIDAYNDLMGY